MLISGVDEAGRGSVIGPLAIAGVSLDEKDLPKLVDLGVKDSKLLSPQKRKTLASQIKKLALNYHIVLLSPAEIDRVVESKRKLHKLNRLEAQAMAKVIAVLKKYPIVSAASIIAKVERDRVISQLQKKHGKMGCGYPSDSNTIKFLEDWIRNFGSYPDFVRKSWKTAKRVKSEADSRQNKLQ